VRDMGSERKRGHSMLILLAAVLLAAGLTGCSGDVAAGIEGTAAPQPTAEMTAKVPTTDAVAAGTDGTAAPQPTAEATTEVPATDAVARPEGWDEETHGKGTEPNYDVVFPDDKVNQITITIDPEDWEAMQANMVDLFGEAGAGGEDRGGSRRV
jgi:pyruvate/2-oxoglutarate dehydrogenase complex dihydrolipoamide acyltransferase (E2) component